MIPDRIRALFARAKEAPKLSPSVVRHQRIDEIVRDDLREHSTRFDNALNTTPTLDLGEDEHGQPREQEYDLAGDLWSDLFYSHYTSGDHVEIKRGEEVRPSHNLHQRIMEHYVNHDEFARTRPLTRDDEMAAALSTMAAQNTLEQELQTTLKEHAERAQQMGGIEDALGDAEKQLQDLREKAKQEAANGAVSEATQDAIRDLAQQKQQGRDALTDLINQQDESGFGTAAANAVDNAAQEAKDIADTWAQMPGTARGQRGTMSPDAAFELATRWKDNDQLREVLKLVGRMERDFRFQRSNRVQGGREEIVDVELGNDIGLLLPIEAMKLGHPILRLQFFKQFAERSLLQFETVGENPSGDGPIIVCRDISGSMGGARIVWASAVSLALLSVAQRERRAFAHIDFTTQLMGVWQFPKAKTPNAEDVLNIASTAPTGGTDIPTAMAEAKRLIDSGGEFRSADIVIVTDGNDGWTEHAKAICDACAERGVRIHSFVIGSLRTAFTDNCAEITGGTAVSIHDLTAPSEATKQIVQAIS